jgi:hypothetical protein
MRYRRKPCEVQAIRWDGTQESENLIIMLAATSFERLDTPWNDDPDATAVCKSDFRGGTWVPMHHGDYVVLDDEGRLFPLKAALLHESYELVVEP